MNRENIIKNIIYLENGKVSVIRHKGDHIEFIRKDGEIDFPITLDFWTWWQRAVSYIEGDGADLCFIYDKQYDLLTDIFLKSLKQVSHDKSVWDIKYIKQFFWKLRPTYFNVCMIGLDGQEFFLSENKLSNATQKVFYTNLAFPSKYLEKNNDSEEKMQENIEIDENDISDIAKYFVDLIRKERGY